MTRDVILRPGGVSPASLHPDQMILFPSGPTIARSRRQWTWPRPPLSPKIAFGVAAFGAGFLAGRLLLGALA
ncbi:MAG: hypothetical protein BGP06_15475 [Rhizobiales bacterium 65-9]|nr:hypothetical protein [Hyphomicrobiales bacterium]OJY37893.1 MAG: hypothetical protein BGP06_15475 [Rhizobiales bacterium 65-9]